MHDDKTIPSGGFICIFQISTETNIIKFNLIQMEILCLIATEWRIHFILQMYKHLCNEYNAMHLCRRRVG